MNLPPSRLLPLLALPLLLLAGPASGEPLDSSDLSRFPLAQSEVDTNIRLGATVDNDQKGGLEGLLDGLLGILFPPDANATADDQTVADDEDGVAVPPLVVRGDTVTIPVTVFNNSGVTAYLNACM